MRRRADRDGHRVPLKAAARAGQARAAARVGGRRGDAPGDSLGAQPPHMMAPLLTPVLAFMVWSPGFVHVEGRQKRAGPVTRPGWRWSARPTASPPSPSRPRQGPSGSRFTGWDRRAAGPDRGRSKGCRRGRGGWNARSDAIDGAGDRGLAAPDRAAALDAGLGLHRRVSWESFGFGCAPPAPAREGSTRGQYHKAMLILPIRSKKFPHIFTERSKAVRGRNAHRVASALRDRLAPPWASPTSVEGPRGAPAAADLRGDASCTDSSGHRQVSGPRRPRHESSSASVEDARITLAGPDLALDLHGDASLIGAAGKPELRPCRNRRGFDTIVVVLSRGSTSCSDRP